MMKEKKPSKREFDKNKVIVHAGDFGDMSVCIPPSEITITIEANFDIRSDITYKDNRSLFLTDLEKFIADWFTDMNPYAILDDTCFDCGQTFKTQGKIHKCKAFELEENV